MDGTSSKQSFMADLQDKIALAKTQLESLDETSDGYDDKKMVLEHGLESLEAQLLSEQRDEQRRRYERDMQFLDNTRLENLPIVGDRPQSSHATHATIDLPPGFAPYAGSSHNRFGGHFASDGVMAGQGRAAAAPSWGFGLLDDPSTTPDTPNASQGDGSGSSSSPDSDLLLPSKRQRESFGFPDQSGRAAKCLRTTPSPAMTGTTTPTSVGQSSVASFEDPDLFRLLGGNPRDHLREMQEEHLAQEKLLEKRRKQEREDEEYARSLAQEFDIVPAAEQPRAGPSTARWGISQTLLDAQGRYRRPDPPTSLPSTIKHEDPFSTATLPVKQGNTQNANMSCIPIKSEKYYQAKPAHIHSDDFIDLESDDDYSNSFNGVGGHPSSDPVEIDPNTFHDNNRQNQVPGFMNGTYNPYGNGTDSTTPANWSYTGGQLGQSLVNTAVNAAKGVYNSAYNLVDQQISAYGSTPMGFGGASVYNNGLDSSSLVPYIDLDSDDQPPQNLAHSYLGLHGINADDPANRALLDSYTDRINYVTHDPTRTTAEIKSLLENIRPDEELPPENREGTPDAMTYGLMEHQKLGLAWMKNMEVGSNKGGILADDMGLGKTIQALALMVARKSADRTCKTNLIIAPVALLKQWEREIQQKLKPTHGLTAYIFHGAKGRGATWAKLRTFDVVITTFGTLANEVKRKEEIEMKKRVNPNWRPTSKSDHLALLGDECKWYRVIIDEAQCIKNKSTQAAKGASQLQALSRFCMTGTPMMNNVTELYSLIHFLRIKPYCEGEKFRRDFTTPLKGTSPVAKDKAMRQLQALLKAILLRRTKKSEIDGRPILNLPERTTEVRHAVFSEDEEDFYRALESRTQLQFNKFLKAGTVGKNYSNILVLLLRLRQACCHPHLIKDFGQASGDSNITPEDMMKFARELAPDVIARIRDLTGPDNEDAPAGLECPVCMDMADNATIFIPCGHNTCGECFARISDPSSAIADGTVAEGRHVDVKCPNCRGKVTVSRVIDHNTFKKVHMPEQAIGEIFSEDPEADVETTDDSDSDSEEDEDDVDGQGNLRGFIVKDEVVEDISETEEEDEDENDAQYRSERKKSKKLNKGKGKAPAKENKAPRKSLAQLKKEGMRNAQARKRYLRRLEKDWMTSGKIEKTMDILRTVQEAKDPEKTIIFSQFTSFLDLLEVPIAGAGWGYRRYDGSMTPQSRNDAVIDFSDKKDCRIMLVSLKAGNAGLNLTVASQVIILDPFWNPYIEEQAIDRAHRIGQQRPVQVHRILVSNTVEDRILALQEKKRELIEGALDEKASQSIGRLGVRELGFLFDVPT